MQAQGLIDMIWYRICYQEHLLENDDITFAIFEDYLMRSWFNKLEKWNGERWVTIAVGTPQYQFPSLKTNL